MSVFSRRAKLPLAANLSAYRSLVREDFEQCCAFCLLHELLAGGLGNFELDHFRPQSLFPELSQDFFNLYYTCHVCNQLKAGSWPSVELEEKGARFLDFCRDDFSDHFREDPDGRWIPLTIAAEYTEARLRLNRPHLMKIRHLLRRLARLNGASEVSWDSPIKESIESWLDPAMPP